jgi:DNA-directed RNA polymerase specialized sigma24 family protein
MNHYTTALEWNDRRNVVSLDAFRKSRERRQMSEAITKSRAEFENAIAVADAEWREDRIRRAEVEAFVDSLNPVSERTRNELIEALL